MANNWRKLKFLKKVNSLNENRLKMRQEGGCMFLVCWVRACVVKFKAKSWNRNVVAAKRI